MKTSKYWAKRYEELEKITTKDSLKTVTSIEKALTKAQNEINGEIKFWYERIAVNNAISYNEAKSLLSAKELVEFKWTVEDYVKYGKENAINGEWVEYLENASAQYHITRLEALKIQTEQALEVAYAKETSLINSRLSKVYEQTYYKSAYELQKGLGVAFNVGKVSENQLKAIMNSPWCSDGANFSSRIWNNKTAMVQGLHEELIRTCIQGKSPDEAIKYMSQFVDKKFENAKVQAGRLVMTEQAYFASKAREESYSDLDVEEYQIIATLDTKTSERCREMDYKHFPVEDFEVGVTAPPFHPWCRTTHVPYFDDEFSVNDKRVARDENGKVYEVDSMNYKDWHDKFVVDGSLTESEESGIINLGSDKLNYIGRIDKEIYSCISDDIITEDVIITNERIKHIMDRHPGDYEFIKDYLADAITNPDYILKDKNMNSGLILKSVNEGKDRFQIVLRVQTSCDDSNYKNSIISGWKISKERFGTYVKNKKILYKSE